jgi:hypothetical protein
MPSQSLSGSAECLAENGIERAAGGRINQYGMGRRSCLGRSTQPGGY